MIFHEMDLQTWNRREHFSHYTSQVPCFYSMCVDVDVTQLKKRGERLYPALLYGLCAVANRHREFRMAFDGEGRLGWFEEISPCYTVFHPETETFSCLWTQFSPDYREFCARYQEDLRLYGTREGFWGKPHPPENLCDISMIPWQTFTGFHLDLPRGERHLLPIFTMGKVHEVQGKWLLPLAVQVHHGVCDGFHVCRFVEELQQLLDRELYGAEGNM